MKLVILSDTHGYVEEVYRRLKEEKGIQMIIHLGDYTQDGLELERKLSIPTFCIKGNNDYADRVSPPEAALTINRTRVYLTHGHRSGVHSSRLLVGERAGEKECVIAFYGHTHIFRDETINGVRILNPGSPVLPRGGDKKSFIIAHIGDGKIDYKRILPE